MTEHPDDTGEPVTRLHLIRDASTLDDDGASGDLVQVPCELLDTLPAGMLARLDIRPSLDECGRHPLT